jgi:hypothetical protein
LQGRAGKLRLSEEVDFMDEQTLIDRVEQAMQTDDEDREKQSGYLADCYNEATTAGKRLIDECFIALCGWSLKSLIDGENE